MRKLVAVFVGAFLFIGAAAAQISLPWPGPGTPASSGGSPTWTGTGAAANGACGFVTTCNVSTTATITTGVVVAMAGVNNQAASSGTITGISVCGTALTVDVANTIANGKRGGAIGHGTVTGGSNCTISVTFSVTGSIENAGVAWGTLNSLTSSTPGTACNAFYDVTQNSPYPCTGGLTVSAGGFGIVGYFDNQTTTPTAGGTLTLDATAANSGGTATEVAIGHVTATCTAAQCEYNAANFAQATVLGEPFR